MPYQFLSDEWVEAARKIREEAGSTAPAPQPVKMNLDITDVPFGEGTVNAHMDTSGGEMEMDIGHLDTADVTVTLDYETAKAIFVDGNPQAAIDAFMAGRIVVQGDITKLMVLQATGPGAAASELTKALQEITE